MRRYVRLIWLIVSGVLASAAVPPTPVRLSINYSEWLGFYDSPPQIATDSTGAIYLLTTALQANAASSAVTKLTPDGRTLLWRNQLDFVVVAFAVDPTGGVYVVPGRQLLDTGGYVAKLSPSGTGLAWKTPTDLLPQAITVIAADAQGRAYLAGYYDFNGFLTQTADVIRLNASGSAIDFRTPVIGTPVSIALDTAGAAYVTGAQGSANSFLAKVNPDGAVGYYTTFSAGISQTVAVDANGNVALFRPGAVQRVDANGAPTINTTIAAGNVGSALDAAGNAYVAAVTNTLYPVKNSLVPCHAGTLSQTLSGYNQLLNVVAPDGSIVQSTYLPGGDALGSPRLAVAPNGTILVVATAGPSFTPTQTGPFSAGVPGSYYLLSLSTTALGPPAQTYPLLACVGNSASFGVSAISPGELVTLSGNGIGPQQGIAAVPTAANLYPKQVANVQVTFDGTPAPLFWVQDTQINLVAPWSLIPRQNTRVCVSYNDAGTDNCLTWPVVVNSPAVFTVDGRYAAALNQDGTYNSANNPAPVNSIVTIYATGLGPIAPSQPDGSLIGFPLPTNTLPISVYAFYSTGIPFGNQSQTFFDVQYAGPAPGSVAGVSQINFRVAPFPSYNTIFLRVDGVTSSPSFAIYVAGQQ